MFMVGTTQLSDDTVNEVIATYSRGGAGQAGGAELRVQGGEAGVAFQHKKQSKNKSRAALSYAGPAFQMFFGVKPEFAPGFSATPAPSRCPRHGQMAWQKA